MNPQLKALVDQVVAEIRATKIKDRDPNDIFDPDDHEDLARKAARYLLRTIDVEDMSGCPLCQN